MSAVGLSQQVNHNQVTHRLFNHRTTSADEAFIIAHVDVNQNEHDDDSLPVKVSKGQKLHRDIENVKDSSGGGKQSHSKQCAHSDDEG